MSRDGPYSLSPAEYRAILRADFYSFAALPN